MCQSSGQNVAVCELLPGRLIWSPECLCAPGPFKGKLISIGELTGEYRIPHYSREACGHAFGPLSLDETLKFCLKVQAMLTTLAKDVEKGNISREAGVLSISTAPKNINERTNAAVLMGAYLILFCNWNVDDVAAAIGHQDSGRLFICSWSRTELEESSRTLSVRNCWEGLQIALQQGWVDCVTENEYAVQSFLQERASISAACDASWIIPSQLLVCADPVTTIYDPNPDTITELFPVEPEQRTTSGRSLNRSMSGAGSSLSRGTSSTFSSTSQTFSAALPRAFSSTAESIQPADVTVAIDVPAPNTESCAGVQRRVRAVQISGAPVLPLKGDLGAPPVYPLFVEPVATDNISEAEPCSPKSVVSFTSLETVSKEYKLRSPSLGKGGVCNMDFTSFLRSNEVRLIVRANFINEHGMPPLEKCRMYDPAKFKSYGVRQVDVQFLDLHGAVPSRYQVHRMLRSCKKYMTGDHDAVVVHCKGGFGRSIVLAACLAIERFDVPGSALLGWLRMARPGSVNTIRQERFLASLRGRADVLSYAGGTGIFPMPACCGSS